MSYEENMQKLKQIYFGLPINLNQPYLDVPCMYFDQFAHLLEYNQTTKRAVIRITENITKPVFRSEQKSINNEIMEVSLNSIKLLAQQNTFPTNLQPTAVVIYDHPLIEKMKQKYPEHQDYVNQISKIPQYEIVQLANKVCNFLDRKLSTQQLQNRNYLHLYRLNYIIYPMFKIQNSDINEKIQILNKSIIGYNKYIPGLMIILGGIRKMMGQIMMLFAKKESLHQIFCQVLQDMSQNMTNQQHLNEEVINTALQNTYQTLEQIREKMEGGTNQNANTFNYTIIQMLVFKLQIIPLLIAVKGDFFCRGLNNTIPYVKAKQIVKNIIIQVQYEMCQKQLTDLEHFLFRKMDIDTHIKCEEVDKFLDQIYKSFEYLNDDVECYGNFFAQYQPTLKIPATLTDQDILIIQHNVNLWLSTIALLNFIFGYFGENYIEGVNYSNFLYILTVKNLPVNGFCSKQKVEFQNCQLKKIENADNELLEIIQQFGTLFNQENICAKIDMKQLKQIFQNFSQNVNVIINKIINQYQKTYLKVQFNEILKTNIQYCKMKEATMKQKKYAYIQKLEEITDMNVFKIKQDDYIFSFEQLKNLDVEIKNKLQVFQKASNFNLFCMFIKVDLFDLSNASFKNHQKLIAKWAGVVKLDILKFSTTIFNDVQFLRSAVYQCVSSPTYLPLGNQIKLFLMDKLQKVQCEVEEIMMANGVNYMSLYTDSVQDQFMQAHFKGFFRPVAAIQLLSLDLFRLQFDLESQKNKFGQMIKCIDTQICNTMLLLDEQFKIIINLSYDEQKMAIDQPQQFVGKYPQFKQNYQKFQFQFKCDQKIQFILLQSLQKCCDIELSSEDINTDQITKNFIKCEDNVTGVEKLNKMKRVITNIIKQYKIYDHVNFNFIFTLAEMKYLLIELSSIQLQLLQWRKWVLSTEKIPEITVLNMKNHSSSSQLLLAMSPVSEILIDHYRITKMLQDDTDIELTKFQAEETVQALERLMQSVKSLNQRALDGDYEITTLRNDYNKQGQLFSSPAQKAQYQGTEEFIAHKIQYNNWLQYSQELCQQILDKSMIISILYLVKCNSFKQTHYLSLSKFLRTQIDKNLTVKARTIIDALQDSDIQSNFIKILLLMRQNAEIDQQAKDKLEIIQETLNQACIYFVFDVKMCAYDHKLIRNVDIVKLQDFLGFKIEAKANLNKISEIIIQPTDLQDICQQSINVVSQIINNIGFLGHRDLKYNKKYELKYQNITEILREQIDSQMFPSELREYEALIKQWRYSPDLEYKCRDMEVIISLIKMIFINLKRLPLMLKDLITLYLNSNIIQFQNHTLSFKINYFSYFQEKQLIACVFYWQYIVEMYLSSADQSKFMDLVINQEFITKLTFAFERINELFNDLKINKFQNVYELLGSKLMYNNLEKNIISTYYQVGVGNNQSKCLVKVIPNTFSATKAKQLFPTSMFINIPQYIIYDTFISDLFDQNIFTQDIMGQITRIKAINVNGKEYIQEVFSTTEKIRFLNLLPAPTRNLEVLDALYPHIKTELIKETFKQWDNFILSINKYKQNAHQQINDSNTNKIFLLPTGKLYEVKQKYVKEVENSDSISTRSRSNAENLVDVLINFYNGTNYQVFCIILSTFCMKYFDKIKNDALKFQNPNNEIQQIFLNFGLMVSSLAKCSKPQNYKLAVKSRIQEWIYVFNELKKIANTKKFYLKQEQIPNHSYAYLNYDTNDIEVTDLKQSFFLKSGLHWQGDASILEQQMLTSQQKRNLSPILQGFYQRQAIFVVGQKDKGYQNTEFHSIVQFLTRMLMMNIVSIFFSESNFANEFQKLENGLICGCICIIYGIEFLSSDQIFELANLSFLVNQEKGKLKTIVNCYQEDDQSISKLQVPLSRKFVKIDYADISDFQNLGHILFFSPQIENVDQSSRIYFHQTEESQQVSREYKHDSHGIQKDDNVKTDIKKNNISYQYQTELQFNQDFIKISKQFENSIITQIDTIQSIEEYTRQQPTYGQSFYYLNQMLQTFNQEFCQISTKTVEIIMMKLKDQTSVYQISILTFDFIIKQCLFFINDDTSNIKTCQVIANIVSSCFGLDLIQATYILNYAQQHYYQLEYSIQQSNIKRKEIETLKRKIQYQKFFCDTIQPILNDSYLYPMQQFALIHQLTIQMTIDLFMCRDMLETKQPLLIISISQSHIKIFMNYLSQLNNEQLFYITNKEELAVAIKNYKTLKLQRGLFIISASSYDSFKQLSGEMFEYFVVNKLNIHIVLAINPLIYMDIKNDKFITLFKQKYFTLPCYEGSLSIKRVFLDCLNVNPYIYVDKANSKLLQHFLGKQQIKNTTPKTILENLFLKDAKIDKSIEDKTLLIQRKSICLNGFMSGCTQIIYDILGKIFNIGTSFEEVLLWRSLTMFFLYKFGVIEPIVQQKNINVKEKSNKEGVELLIEEAQIQDDIRGFDSVYRSYIQDYLKSKNIQNSLKANFLDDFSYQREHISQVVESDTDLAGFSMQHIQNMDQSFQKYYNLCQKDFEKALASFYQSNATEKLNLNGFGSSNSIQYQFNEQFIYEAYYEHENISEAFQHLLLPMMTAMYNGAQLYFLTVRCSNKFKEIQSGNALEELQHRYDSFIRKLINVQNIDTFQLMNMNLFIVLISNQLQNYTNFRTESMQQFNIKLQRQTITNHGLTQDQQYQVIKDLFQKATDQFPKTFSNITFGYLNYSGKMVRTPVLDKKDFYANKVSIQEYKVGEGVLKNITQEDDSFLLENNIQYVCAKVTQQRQKNALNPQQMQKIDPQKIVDEYDYQQKVSIQKNNTFKIHLDQLRSALCIMLACCMQTPLTTCLYGSEKMGKTVLIQCAALISRDLVDYNLAAIQKSESHFINSAIRQAIAEKTSLQIENNKMKLKYYQILSFPCIHIHASDVTSQVIGDDFLQMVRDHYVRIKGQDITVDNQQEDIIGLLPLQDTSFIIECQNNSVLQQVGSISIQIPPLTEQFITEVLHRQFQRLDKSWVEQFIGGFFMLKSNIKCKFLHNFQVITKLVENKFLTINQFQYFSYNEIQKIQEYKNNPQNQQKSYDTSKYSKKQLIQYLYHNFKQPIIQQILSSQDDLLYQTNLWSAFFVFQTHLEEKINMQLEEKLPTLTILGYLNSTNKQQTPWDDYQKVLDKNMSIVPIWQAFTINQKLIQTQLILNGEEQQNDKTEFSNNIAKQISSDIFYLEPKLDISALQHIDKLFDREQLVSFGLFGQNAFFFAHYLELYKLHGQHIDPYIANKVFELFINLEIQKESNISKLSTLIKYGLSIRSNKNLTGIYAEDDMLPSRHYLTNQAAKFSAIIFDGNCKKKNFKHPNQQQMDELIKQDNEVMQTEKEFVQDLPESQFGGFSLSSIFAMQTPKLQFTIQNATDEQYKQVLEVFNGISSYQSIHQGKLKLTFPNIENDANIENHDESRSVSQSNSQVSMRSQMTIRFQNQEKKQGLNIDSIHSNKIIVDIDGIQSKLEEALCKPFKKVQLSEQQLRSNDSFDIVNTLVQIMNFYRSMNVYDQKQLDFICVLYILRITVCLAAGVRPYLVFNDQQQSEIIDYLGFNLQSRLSSCYPYKIVSSGKNINQLPIKCINFEAFVQRVKLGKRNYNKNQKVLDLLTSQPMEVIVIGSKAKFDQESSSGVSIMQLLNSLIEPLSILPTIFSQQEQQCISTLLSHNFGVESVNDKKITATILSTNLSIIIIDTNEKIKNVLNTRSLGIVQQPMHMLNQLNKMYDRITLQKSLLIQSSYKFGKALLQVIETSKIIQYIQNYLYQQKGEYNNYNIILMQQQNPFVCSYLQETFYLPKCNLKDVLKFKDDDELLIIIGSYSIYRYMQAYKQQPICSYSKYLKIIQKLYEYFLNKVQIFVDVCEKVDKMYDYYQNLISFITLPPKQLDMQKLSIVYVQKIIAQIQNKAEIQMKLEGMIINKEQQDQQYAIGEVIVMRDVFYSIKNFLESEKQIYQSKLNTLAVDCITCGAYLQFCQSQQICTAKIQTSINTGEFGEISTQLKYIQQLIQQNHPSYDLYNFAIISILQLQGIKVCYPKFMNQEIYNKNDNSSFTQVASHTHNYGQEMFLNNYIEMSAQDTASFMLARHYQMDWQKGDPYLSILNSCAIYSMIGYTNFVVNREIAMATAYLIATRNKILFNFTLNTIDLQDDQEDTNCQRLIEMHKESIVFIDMCDKYATQLQSIKKALEMENVIIVLYNFGSPYQNVQFFHLMKKFLLQKCKDDTKNLLQIRLGNLVLKFKQPINKITMIIGTYHDSDIFRQAEIDFGEQQVIDNLAIVAIPIKQQKRTNLWIFENLQQKLQQAIFGQQQSKRSTTEMIKLLQIQGITTYNVVTKILDRLLVTTGQIQNYATVQERYQVIFKIQLLNSPIKAMVNEMFNSVRKIQVSQITSYLMYSENHIDRYNKPIYLKCLNFQNIRRIQKTQLDKIVDAIYYTLYMFKRFCQYHLPSISLAEEDTIRQICIQVNILCLNIQQQHLKSLDGKYPNISSELQHFALVYPITHYMTVNTQKFKQMLISVIFDAFITRSVPLFKPDYSQALWIQLTNIFTVVTGNSLLEYSEDFRNDRINSTDIDIIPRLLSNNFKDTVRQATISSISSAFQQSLYAIDKITNSTQLQNTKQFKKISQLQPDICNISSKLQYYWSMMLIIARHNKLMDQQLTWFARNNAAFVYMAQVDSIYCSYLRGLYKKDENTFNHLSKDNDSFKQLHEQLFNNQKINKVQTLPPSVQTLDQGTNFTIFTQSLALEPDKMLTLIQYYGSTIQHITKYTAQQYNNLYFPNSFKQIHGVILSHSQYKLTIDEVANFMSVSYIKCFQIFTQQKDIKIQKDLVPDCVFQLANAIYQSGQIMCNTMHNTNVFLVYYDQCISIIQLMNYVFNIIPPEKRGNIAPLLFTREINIEMVKNYTCALLLDPLSSGYKLINDLEIICELKQSSLRDTPLNPVFIFIPSCLYAERMESSLEGGGIRCAFQLQEKFTESLQNLLQQTDPNYVYIQKPVTPIKGLLHILTLSISVIFNSNVDLWFKGSRIVSLRGLILLSLKNTFMMLQETISYSDSQVVAQISQLITKMKQITQNTLLLKDDCKFGVQSMNDMQILQFISHSHDAISQIGEQRIKDQFDQFNLDFAADMGQVMIEVFSFVVSKERTINEQIRNRINMDGNESDDESSEENAQMNVQQEFDVSEQSQASITNETSTSQDTSQMSSSKSHSVTVFSNQQNAKRMERQRLNWRQITTNIYNNMIQKLITQGNKLISKLNCSVLEQSVEHVLSPPGKRIIHLGIPIPPQFKKKTDRQLDLVQQTSDLYQYIEVPVQRQDIQKTGKMNTMPLLYFFIDKINKLSEGCEPDEFDSKFNQFNRNLLRQAFCRPPVEQAIRNFMSADPVKDTVSQIFYKNLVWQASHFQDVKKQLQNMPDQLQVFIKLLQDIQYNTLVTSKQQNDDELFRNVFKNESVQAQFLNTGFIAYDSSWQLDAGIFGQVLGNIFQFVKVMQSLKTGSQIYNQRLIVMAEKPIGQPKLNKNGIVEYETTNEPFFHIEIHGMTLFGLAFNEECDTVCDISSETLLGYNTPIILYASVVTLDYLNDDYYDKEQPLEVQLLVNELYVPVPLKIGGICRPIVLLPNRTKISSSQYRVKNPYFAVKLI